jgi:hypothetical protein
MRLKPIKILVIQEKTQTNQIKLKNPKLNQIPINTKENPNKSDKVLEPKIKSRPY